MKAIWIMAKMLMSTVCIATAVAILYCGFRIMLPKKEATVLMQAISNSLGPLKDRLAI